MWQDTNKTIKSSIPLYYCVNQALPQGMDEDLIIWSTFGNKHP